MHIQFVEIQNFRKLKSIRIDFASKTTLFVGANNSGKTSAMEALGYFLVDQSNFTTNDFTLSNWMRINEIGRTGKLSQINLVLCPLLWRIGNPYCHRWIYG